MERAEKKTREMVGEDNFFRWDLDLEEEIPLDASTQKQIDKLLTLSEKYIAHLDSTGEFDKFLKKIESKYNQSNKESTENN